MLPHPAAPNASDIVRSSPNYSAAGVICNKPVDAQQHHCNGCRYGGGVDRRHAAVARCIADVIQSHSGARVFIELEVPALTRVVNGQTEHARMDLVYRPKRLSHVFGCLHCCSFLLQSVPGLSSQHKTRTHGQKSREEQIWTDIHTSTSFLSSSRPQVGLAHMPGNSSATSCEMPTIPGQPSQSVLHRAISKQQLTAAVT